FPPGLRLEEAAGNSPVRLSQRARRVRRWENRTRSYRCAGDGTAKTLILNPRWGARQRICGNAVDSFCIQGSLFSPSPFLRITITLADGSRRQACFRQPDL